ncbi:aldolase/citrate lyase family protein [uncultured Celeribacter sp.]|uniref:HpcH/HpaI aldolase family protein n=1 Tax=uncultured Celeribacter sp. TaxID=1303376 RepID=UPI002AA62453|nr:aldolase/citrate lyase family protein [uncultured Celeribacter sp.]
MITEKLKTIREKIASKDRVNVAWLFLGSPVTAEIMAAAGFDFLILDMEHAPGGRDAMYHQIRACEAQGVPVIVRIPEVNAGLIKQALDAGSAGIALPDVRSLEEAERLVKLSRYAPQGQRGTHRLARAAGYGMSWQEYYDEVVPNLLAMVLIESPEGAAIASEMGAMDGIDVIFIGAVDLASCLGHVGNPGHPEVQAVIRQIEADVLASGAALGGLAGSPQDAAKKFEAGYSVATCGSDAVFLRDHLQSIAKELDLLP